jgi:hypothetical protein
MIITRKDWLIAGIFTLLTITLLQLPYIAGYATTPPDKVYTGLIMNPEDSQTYFAKMRQGFEGEWLYTISFTPEPHEPALVGVFYVGLGHVARIFGGTITNIWHVSRVIAGIFLFLTTFWYITQYTQNRRTVWVAFLLAIFGSGLGWLLFVVGQPYWLNAFPVDFKMPEAHLFFMAMTFPHVAAGTALTLIVFRQLQQIIDNLVSLSPRPLVLLSFTAGILNLTIALIYPFLIYLIVAVTGIYFLLTVLKTGIQSLVSNLKLLIPLAIPFLIPAPLILYYAITLNQNPIFAAWNTQAGLPSPPIPHYLIAFGLFLLFAGIGWRQNKQHTFLWVWVFMAAILVYVPVEAQRRFVQGVQVPLSILAAIGLVNVGMPAFFNSKASTNPLQRILKSPRYTQPKLENFLLTLFLLFMSLSNIYLLASVTITAAVQQPPQFFRSQAENAGISWLTQHTQHTDVVLGTYQAGNYIAAHAGNQVIVGHWAETLNFEQKEKDANQFFDPNTSDQWRREFVEGMDVAYVWTENGELDGVAWLMPAFNQHNITIYTVSKP